MSKIKTPFILETDDDGSPILCRKVKATTPGAMDCKEILVKGAEIFYLALYLAEHYDTRIDAVIDLKEPENKPQPVKKEVIIGEVVAECETGEYRLELDRLAICKEDLDDHFHMTLERAAEDMEAHVNQGLGILQKSNLVPIRFETEWHRGKEGGEYVYGYFQPALVANQTT
jgi:hypothetical protein